MIDHALNRQGRVTATGLGEAGVARRGLPALVCWNCRTNQHQKCTGVTRRRYSRGLAVCECPVCAKRKKAALCAT